MKHVEVNIETIRELSGCDRAEAKRLYEEWRDRQRKTDRRLHFNMKAKIQRHLRRMREDDNIGMQPVRCDKP